MVLVHVKLIDSSLFSAVSHVTKYSGLAVNNATR